MSTLPTTQNNDMLNMMLLGGCGALVFLGAPFVGRDIEINHGHLMDRTVTKILVLFAVVWLATRDALSATLVTIIGCIILAGLRVMFPRQCPNSPESKERS